MKKLIGTYFLGHESVDVFVHTKLLGGTGELPGGWAHGGSQYVGEIVVGIQHERWSVVLENIMHEGFEYLASKYFVRFKPSLTISDETDNCLFVMTHPQFSEITAGVAELMSQCQPKILAAHQKLHRKRKKK